MAGRKKADAVPKFGTKAEQQNRFDVPLHRATPNGGQRISLALLTHKNNWARVIKEPQLQLSSFEGHRMSS
ncbi:hypothetical protein CEXT_349761 [Caerostris extrusa]|uniref:Uncharacterized protein n=1 Tax=Caerostris extrusa TaxID=172846 RepID=A0AAV4QKK7_CAEEX|nr:hypothetical protein CEXT_349761 [Caerostris extrusa]